MTVKTTVHVATFVAQSVTVTVIGYVPGNTIVPGAGVCEQLSGPQLSEAQFAARRQRFGMALEQAVTVSCTTAGSWRQLQARTGGVVSTTVTVWLQVAVAPQLSVPCQVRVMTSGHVPLVVVLATVMVTLPTVPAGGQQAFVQAGGSKVHVVWHSTVLLGAQMSANGPVCGELTVNTTVHDAVLPAQSVTVTVIG
jgi:hypothetical protein